MHYTLVLSPEGPTLLRMIESVHKLLPYMLIRQTLKVGNVATMLSGIMKIVLAKASVASVTNWIGLSSGADEGMNLLQQYGPCKRHLESTFVDCFAELSPKYFLGTRESSESVRRR